MVLSIRYRQCLAPVGWRLTRYYKKYVDPHPARHYQNLLHVPMTTPSLTGNGGHANGNASQPNNTASDLPW
jgi:hypothetical protein